MILNQERLADYHSRVYLKSYILSKGLIIADLPGKTPIIHSLLQIHESCQDYAMQILRAKTLQKYMSGVAIRFWQ